jgi:REP element-mobilizing transposase RayT
MAIAYFHTWTTYGTWLPGDARGWFLSHRGLQPAELQRELESAFRMTDDALVLNVPQRQVVEQTISDHCSIRKWELHAVNCRTNHVHVVVTANRELPIVREQFKAWCTRRLKASSPIAREKWWTERGWDEFIDDESGLAATIEYVLFRQ